LVSGIKGGTHTKGAEENIWTGGILNDRRLKKLHNEDPHNLYSLSSIITMMKSRKMRWAGHVAQMGEKRNAYRILVGKETTKNAKT
jgi:hypothetical protein